MLSTPRSLNPKPHFLQRGSPGGFEAVAAVAVAPQALEFRV